VCRGLTDANGRCAHAPEKDLELKTVHKSDGEAIAVKTAAVERLQVAVRQLEETVHKEQAKVEREETARKKVEAAAAEARQAGDRAMHAKQAELQQAQLQLERSKDEAQRLGAALAGALFDIRISLALPFYRSPVWFIHSSSACPCLTTRTLSLVPSLHEARARGAQSSFAPQHNGRVCVNTRGGWVRWVVRSADEKDMVKQTQMALKEAVAETKKAETATRAVEALRDKLTIQLERTGAELTAMTDARKVAEAATTEARQQAAALTAELEHAKQEHTAAANKSNADIQQLKLEVGSLTHDLKHTLSDLTGTRRAAPHSLIVRYLAVLRKASDRRTHPYGQSTFTGHTDSRHSLAMHSPDALGREVCGCSRQRGAGRAGGGEEEADSAATRDDGEAA
jgi:hypothetical protein